MRPSPKQFLHGLLYAAPILLLALASCGGGGGGSTTPGAPVITYTIGGAASGVLATTAASGLVLRNNGGDDLAVASGVTSYKFSTPVVAGTPYSVTVLKHPSSPVQKCTVASPSGTATNNVTNANVSCVGAYTVGGSISGLSNDGLVLQNNGADNYLAASGVTSYTFSAPVATGDTYGVTVLTDPQGLKCTPAANGGTVGSSNISVSISCVPAPASPPADPYVYAANFGSANVSTYTSASGVLTTSTAATAGSGPTSIAVAPGSKFAYVTNQNSNTLSVYSIVSGALTPLTSLTIATGASPYSIAIHPSGKFAYVANYLGNSVSVYSIDPATGALASIDADGGTAGTQNSIPTRSNPISIAIDPSGSHAYVANAGSNDVSVYSIDNLTGALTAISASGSGTPTFVSVGTTPYSVKVGPNDQHLYVANRGSNSITIFNISSGTLTFSATVTNPTTTNPVAIAIDPTGSYVYVVNYTSNSVYVYQANIGGLNKMSQVPTGTHPISISIDSTGQYAYVANSGSNDISAYSISATDGALTLVPCSCGSGPNSPAGTQPYAVTTAK